VLETLKTPFRGLETVYQLNKYFLHHSCFVPSRPFTIGYLLESKKQQSKKKKIWLFLLFQNVILVNMFPTKAYLASTNDLLCDFNDGEIWINYPICLLYANHANTLVIPVFDYLDDLEIFNPLGSHANVFKVGVKYTMIKGLPPMYKARLENSPLNTVIRSSDRKHFTDKDCFGVYIDEMIHLEKTGFNCIINGFIHKVFIVVEQGIGDNLAQNSILGFTESFSCKHIHFY
jgi:hypothetical protein